MVALMVLFDVVAHQSACFIQCALQSRHIVAWVRFHWSSKERCFKRERFVGRACFILAASARARRWAQRTEPNGGFGFQTKVKDHFLNQRRWTCWFSCIKNMQVSDSQFSFTFLFVLKSLLSLLFTSRYAMEDFLILYIIIYLIPQCLLNIL